jgi:hypothetical protein
LFHLVFQFSENLITIGFKTSNDEPPHHCHFSCAGSKTGSDEIFEPAVIVCSGVVI